MGLPNPSVIVWAEVTCGVCGIRFCVDHEWHKNLKETGCDFVCPRGCQICYRDNKLKQLERELQQERKRKEWAEQLARNADRHAVAQERRATAYKGHLTRQKRRAANGVCPCCKRTFKDLARHMSGKHPEYVAEANKEK